MHINKWLKYVYRPKICSYKLSWWNERRGWDGRGGWSWQVGWSVDRRRMVVENPGRASSTSSLSENWGMSMSVSGKWLNIGVDERGKLGLAVIFYHFLTFLVGKLVAKKFFNKAHMREINFQPPKFFSHSKHRKVKISTLFHFFLSYSLKPNRSLVLFIKNNQVCQMISIENHWHQKFKYP